MSTITQDNLEGQRALVTGATSGIGRAVALQLARDGAEVLVHGRDAARGAETVQEITAAGGKASFVAADLGDPADVQRLASDVGDVDILINNAGIALFGPTAEFEVCRIRQDVREQRPRAVLPRRGAGSRDGCEGPRQHRQRQQHGRRRRARGRRGLRRDEGVARGDDARLGRGVQRERGARQRDRPRTRLHPDAVRPGVHHGARRDDADAPRLTARGDRRGRSPSSPPHERATSPAPPSPPTADAERSSPNHSHRCKSHQRSQP